MCGEALTAHRAHPDGRGWGSARCRARDAAGGCRASLETSVRNRRAAAFAHTERSRVDACERSVDRSESATSLVSQRRDLRPGDGDRRTLRVVLVVDVRIARRLDDVGPTLIQPPQASHRLPTFLDQQRASSVRGHAPIVRSPSANPPRHRDERQWAELHRNASRRDGDASRRPPRHAPRRSATQARRASPLRRALPQRREHVGLLAGKLLAHRTSRAGGAGANVHSPASRRRQPTLTSSRRRYAWSSWTSASIRDTSASGYARRGSKRVTRRGARPCASFASWGWCAGGCRRRTDEPTSPEPSG